MVIYGPIAVTISVLVGLVVLLVTTIVYSPLAAGLLYVTKTMASQMKFIYKRGNLASGCPIFYSLLLHFRFSSAFQSFLSSLVSLLFERLASLSWGLP